MEAALRGASQQQQGQTKEAVMNANSKKLQLTSEVIRVLSSDDLDEVIGGNVGPVSSARPPQYGPQTGYRPATTKVSSVKPNPGHHKLQPTSSIHKGPPVTSSVLPHAYHV
jgi:hypothetical protein